MKINKIVILVIVFSIAFAFIESSVVVYIRELYYPEGFDFPLKPMAFHIIVTEIFRELSTIIILISIGVLTGKSNIEKFAYFILSFAIWDIFYYVFLKILIDWPESLLTWDILFFIPLTWVGPVIAPVINSITMIILASCIIFYVQKSGKIKFDFLLWSLLVIGSLITIYGYTEEYTFFMLQEFNLIELFGFGDVQALIKYAINFIPEYFNWYIFSFGELLFFTAIFIIIKRNPCHQGSKTLSFTK
ncbi:MAG: hypothetical protein K8S00_03820 [Bacteroidales bacterium]|nr:hypothetical protein [Bacteroidales bacterium]